MAARVASEKREEGREREREEEEEEEEGRERVREEEKEEDKTDSSWALLSASVAVVVEAEAGGTVSLLTDLDAEREVGVEEEAGNAEAGVDFTGVCEAFGEGE